MKIKAKPFKFHQGLKRPFLHKGSHPESGVARAAEGETLRKLAFLLAIPLLILLIGALRRFFDASMRENISRYLASPEGRNMARVYILLVITAVVVTFPRQLKKALQFAAKKGEVLCVKGLALIRFAAKFLKAVPLHTQGRRLFRTRQRPFSRRHLLRRNKHRRKTA